MYSFWSIWIDRYKEHGLVGMVGWLDGFVGARNGLKYIISYTLYYTISYIPSKIDV